MKSRYRICVTVLSVLLIVLLPAVLSLSHVQADQILTNDAGTLNSSTAGIAVEGSGNVFVTGSSLSMGKWPSLGVLLKYTPSGTLQFLRSYPEQLNPQDSFGAGVGVDTSENVYFAGSSKSIGAAPGEFFNAFIVKYNPSMDIVWQRTWGGSIGDAFARALTVDVFDNVYVVGTTNGFWTSGAIPGTTSVFLLKYDGSEGVQTFQAIWGGLRGNDFAGGVAVDNLGHVYVTGTTYGYGFTPGHGSVFLLKYDLTGDLLNGRLLYQKVWGGNSTDYGYGVAVDNIGNVYVTGTTYSYATSPGHPSVFLLKYDPTGNLLWQKIWGGASNDYGYGVAVDNIGNVYVTGATYSYSAYPGHPNVFLLEYDQSGNLLYQKTWGGARADYGYGVVVDQLGSVYVTGYTFSFGFNPSNPSMYNNPTGFNEANLFLLKYDSSGNLFFQRIWSGTPINA